MTKLYAVKLKDGTWWATFGTVCIYTDATSATQDMKGMQRKYASMRGARVVPVRLVEASDE